MYHLRLKGTHYQMGVKRGNIFNRCGITFPLNLDGFQLSHGIKSEKILREYFPEVCEEIRGVSDTVKADYSVFSAWLLCMGCCMYNLERNIPVEIRGCTAFALSCDGKTYYGRNNDLPPFLKSGCKSEIYSPLNANKFNLTTSSFINGEEGLNEHGLAVAMTFVMSDLKAIVPGFNSCFIVRYLLEKATSTRNATELLFRLPVSSNCNILIADKYGDMVVVECTPRLKRIRNAINTSRGKIICTVNNFSSDEMLSYDFSDGNVYQSRERYGVVISSYERIVDGEIIGNMQNLLKGKYGFTCQYEKSLNFETVWSSVFDLNNLTVYRAEGNPARTKFITDRRLIK